MSGHKPAGKDIPESLRERREALELTRKEVAAAIGVDVSTIQRWELSPESPHHRRIAASDFNRLWDYYSAVEAERNERTVPRGTVSEPGVFIGYSSDDAPVIASLERELIRLGADDFEADMVRYLASQFSSALRVWPKFRDPSPVVSFNFDKELEFYLEQSVRPWVMARIRDRSTEADAALPAGAKFERPPKAERPSTAKRQKGA